MFRIETYMESLTIELKSFFGDRLLYLGLQGSYLRGEATNISAFPYTCKSAFFILQNMHYLSSGDFLLTKQELFDALTDEEDKKVLALSMALKGGGDYDFDSAFSTLFEWCRHALSRLAAAE